MFPQTNICSIIFPKTFRSFQHIEKSYGKHRWAHRMPGVMSVAQHKMWGEGARSYLLHMRNVAAIYPCWLMMNVEDEKPTTQEKMRIF